MLTVGKIYQDCNRPCSQGAHRTVQSSKHHSDHAVVKGEAVRMKHRRKQPVNNNKNASGQPDLVQVNVRLVDSAVLEMGAY